MMPDMSELFQHDGRLESIYEEAGFESSCFFNMPMDYAINDFIMTGCTPTSYNSSTIETDATLRNADYVNNYDPFDVYEHEMDSERVFPMSGMYMFQQFEHGENYINRSSESGGDGDPKNHALTLRFNSLTESVLKQLETPLMEPSCDPNSGNSECSTDIDPRLLERLYNAGVNIGAIVSPILTRKQAPTADGADGTAEGANNDASAQLKDSSNVIPPLDLNSSEAYVETSNETISLEGNRVNGAATTATAETAQAPAATRSKSSKKKSKRGEEAKAAGSNKNGGNSVSTTKSAAAGNSNKPASSKTKSLSKGGFYSVTPGSIKNAVFSKHAAASILAISKDQAGCRMLQKLLETSEEPFIDAVLEGVMSNLVELMTDPFGNYLCQKLMSVCSESHLTRIINAIGDGFLDVALNMHGTRALQKLIEVIRKPAHIDKITSVLKKGAVELVTDLNGNHVIQTCLTSLNPDECQFIYDTMYENCVLLATHRHGCCVMQRCIDAANPLQRRKLIEIITDNVLHLVEDAYGNYVIQYTLKLKIEDINARMVRALAPNVTDYAKQKYSSNVIERCLMICPPESRTVLVARFIGAPFPVLKDLILHPFGNYVIQRVLSVAKRSEIEAILETIYPHIDELRTAALGKRLGSKIAKRHSLETSLSQERNGRPETLPGVDHRSSPGTRGSAAMNGKFDIAEQKANGKSKNGDNGLTHGGSNDKRGPKKGSGGNSKSSSVVDTRSENNGTIYPHGEYDDDGRNVSASPSSEPGRRRPHASIGLLEMLLSRRSTSLSNAQSGNRNAVTSFHGASGAQK